MKITGETKALIGIFAATIGIITLAVAILSKSAPTLSKETLIPADAHTLGSAAAAVYLVEFSDFQCPACKTFQPVVKDLANTYKDRLYFAYRHFPLDQHVFAQKAAIAAEASGKQGKFWEMHDLLFERQKDFSENLFLELAKQIELNEDMFSESLKDPLLQKKIENDKSYGFTIGINATPTFFLNGRKLDLVVASDLKKEVEKVIKK